jgi:hypothetical protein
MPSPIEDDARRQTGAHERAIDADAHAPCERLSLCTTLASDLFTG